MAEPNPGVNPEDSPASAGAGPSEEVDERGVPLQNVVSELQRKLQKAEETNAQVINYLNQLEQERQRAAQPAPTPAEDARQKALQDFAADPEGWEERRYRERRRQEVAQEIQSEANEVAQELRSQEYWSEDLGNEILKTVQTFGMQGLRPRERAERAIAHLKLARPELFGQVDPNQARDKAVGRYQVSGPGRKAPPPPSANRQELLKQLQQPNLSWESRADIVRKLSADAVARMQLE